MNAPRTPLRLVLDTNVWLDWLVFDDPRVTALRDAVEAGAAEIVTSIECEAELERVLGYPFRHREPLPETRRTECLAEARRIARPVETPSAADAQPLPLCRDPDDRKFLELARDARADVLVSRDDEVLRLARHRGSSLPFRIVPPSALADLFDDASQQA